MKSVTVDQMLGIIDDSIKARQAKYGENAAPPGGPMLTFLVGAGFSVTAGLSSVNHLVIALETFRKDKNRSWFDIFDQTLDVSLNEQGVSGPELTDYYFNLMGEVLPLPQSRHDFITAAIQWASERRVQMNIEGILLANLMIAGTGGDTHFHPRRKKRHWMAKAFTRHVFTTNFDEVMPNTFYFGNQPVEIIDAPGRNIHSAAEYPTVVYLHGRHLHYDLRNTRTELHAKKKKKKESNEEDLFESFRKLLKHTGLVVIGYAGAKDKVTQTILEALEDGNSLPYGLWWSAYRDESALFDEVKDALNIHERAFVLDPGKDAEQIMRSISKGAGLDEVRAIERWTNRLVTVNNAVTKFLARASYDFRQFNMNAVESLLLGDDESIQNVAEEWTEIKDHVFDHADKLFVVDVLENAAKVLVEAGKKELALEVFEELYALIEKIGNNESLAKTSFSYGNFRVLSGDVKKARKNFQTALEAYKKQGSQLGEAQTLVALAKLDLLQDKNVSALRNAVNAEKIFSKFHYSLGIGDCKSIQGVTASLNHDFEKALQFMTEAQNAHAEDGNPNEIINDLRSIGHLLMSQGKIEEAKEKFDEALKNSKTHNLKREIAHSQKALADYFLEIEDLMQAQSLLELSRKGFVKQFDFRGLLEIEFHMALIQSKTSQINKEEFQLLLKKQAEKAAKHGFIKLSETISKNIIA